MTYLQITQKTKTQKKTKLLKICYINSCIVLYSLKAIIMEGNFLVFFWN